MIILVIIGALIGAGFASGQEIYLFFYKYGHGGLLGILVCCSLISLIIYKVFKLIVKYNINSYKDFLDNIFRIGRSKGKYLNISYIMNIIVNSFLLISFFIMIAGFGAYFNQEFRISGFIGSGILALICFIVFLKDMKGVAKVSSFVVPIMILFIIIIGIKNMSLISIGEIGYNVEKIKTNIFNNWFTQSIIYASYNIILLIPVLVNLKKYIKSDKQIKSISILSGGFLCVLAIIIYMLLINIDINFNTLEMPAVYAISILGLGLKRIYGIVILLSIFTTAISIGMSFLENIVKNKNSFPQYAAIMCITAPLISDIGFSNLVNLLFPVFGYLGLIEILGTFLKSHFDFMGYSLNKK